MERLLKICAFALPLLALAALIAFAFMVITADRGDEEVSQNIGAPYPIPPAPTPMPATVADDVYIGDPPDSARDVPILTEDQISEAKSVLNSDERLKDMLSGESFAVTKTGPWYDDGGLIGALVMIELDNPVSYTGSFPAVGFPPDGEGYITGEISVQADGIESLEMMVDLDKRIVANIRIEKATGEVCLDYGNPQWANGPLGGFDIMIWTLTAPKSPICPP